MLKLLHTFLIETEICINSAWPPVSELHNLLIQGLKPDFLNLFSLFVIVIDLTSLTLIPALNFPLSSSKVFSPRAQ